MFFFRILLIFILIPFISYATIYEDAEDKKISRWKLLNHDFTSSIRNLHDANKKSRIIEFRGDGTKYVYELKTKKSQKNEFWLSWQMKFTEDFVIIVVLNTNRGERYLIYTSGRYNSYMQYGLGYDTKNSMWQTLSRNLQEDIEYFDNRVKVISLKSFVLKGNGKIDNIMSQKRKVIDKVKLIKKSKLIKEYKQKKVLKEATNSLPVITVRGIKLKQLNLGEAYVEEGVFAYDKEDGDINVVSMENIDTNEVGRYMVLYMATDSHGNMALEKRYVHVGKVEIEETSVSLSDSEIEEADEDYSDKNISLSEEEEQIRIWENELALREKELIRREKNGNKDYKKH